MDGLCYYLMTYGCQKNKFDSEVISAIVEKMGYSRTDRPERADLILLNTCCVRDNADQKVYGRLGQLKQLKKKNGNLILAVTGCLAQKDKEQLLRRVPYLDIVLGTHDLNKLDMAVKAVRNTGCPFLSCELKGFDFEALPVKRESKFSTWIPVSEGCNCHCTFCIVPSVRGKMASRSMDNILNDIRDFAEKGGVEVTLLGQNVNSYGIDLDEKVDFSHLLIKVNSVKGIRRIRFTSPHPKYFTPDFISTIRDLENVCEHIHLPLQAGDDAVLRRMGRGYSSSQYREVVENLRREIPGVSITTDIIVGFPQESREQFNRTLRFVEELQFDGAYMFAYSERKGTAAVKMKGQIPPSERMERLYQLLEIQNRISREKNKAIEGTVEEVLVENVSKKNRAFLTGRTRKNKVVNFEGKIDLIGEFRRVKLEFAYTWGFMGKLV